MGTKRGAQSRGARCPGEPPRVRTPRRSREAAGVVPIWRAVRIRSPACRFRLSNCKREKRGARSLTRARARALPAPLHSPAAGRARARRSLARLAGLDDFSGLAKPVLFARLKEHNLDRLTRVR